MQKNNIVKTTENSAISSCDQSAHWLSLSSCEISAHWRSLSCEISAHWLSLPSHKEVHICSLSCERRAHSSSCERSALFFPLKSVSLSAHDHVNHQRDLKCCPEHLRSNWETFSVDTEVGWLIYSSFNYDVVRITGLYTLSCMYWDWTVLCIPCSVLPYVIHSERKKKT